MFAKGLDLTLLQDKTTVLRITLNFLGGAGRLFVGGYLGLSGLLTGFVFIEPSHLRRCSYASCAGAGLA